jgi:hypothetical protein
MVPVSLQRRIKNQPRKALFGNLKVISCHSPVRDPRRWAPISHEALVMQRKETQLSDDLSSGLVKRLS